LWLKLIDWLGVQQNAILIVEFAAQAEKKEKLQWLLPWRGQVYAYVLF
jgi:hypothetical protein